MKIGTIGSGFIVRTILDKVAVTEGIQCCAVYSRSYETGRKLADTYGVEKVYTDLDGLCSDPELDFIYIASPNSLHYEHVKKALEYGKNVMCEKPFVPTAAEADELIALAKAKDVYLIEMITTLYHPHFAWVKEVQSSSRVAKESWGLLSSDCRANRPHLGLCPEANVPLQGRQGSRGCIPDAPGETGIHLEWKQRSPLCSRVATGISGSSLGGLKGVKPPEAFGEVSMM